MRQDIKLMNAWLKIKMIWEQVDNGTVRNYAIEIVAKESQKV